MSTSLTHALTGGIDRSLRLNASPPESFFDLLNFRQNNYTRGILEQTPYFYAIDGISVGLPYYDGGNLNEPSTSTIRYINTLTNNTSAINPFIVTDYTIQKLTGSPLTGQAMKVFYQTTVPTGESVLTGCFLVINDITSLGITLGSTFEVVIEVGGVTFKYRKNGGAYTTAVPITTAGVSVDGGNATVYFLESSGFNAGDSWVWTRLDRSYSNSTYKVTTLTLQGLSYKSQAFFTTVDGRVMTMPLDGTGTQYVISAGYRPVYGSHLVVFGDHLIVGGFSKTEGFYSSGTRVITVGWSDKGDLQNFIPTDTNEADQTTLSFNIYDDNTVTKNAILGLTVLNRQLYIISTVGIFTTPDLGLPIVFSYEFVTEAPLLKGSGLSVIQAIGGVYLLGTYDIYFFDGSGMTLVATKIAGLMAASSAPFYDCVGTFNKQTRELVLYSSVLGRFVVYQEKYQEWYTRGASFLYLIKSIFIDNNDHFYCGQSDLNMRIEDKDWSHQPSKDSATGTVYVTPKVTTQGIVSSQLSKVKEIVATFLGFTSVNASVSTTYYSTAANLQAQLYWYTIVNSNPSLVTSPTTDTAAVCLIDVDNSLLSYPRVKFRCLLLEIQLNGLVTNKPPGQGAVNAIEPVIVNLQPTAVL